MDNHTHGGRDASRPHFQRTGGHTSPRGGHYKKPAHGRTFGAHSRGASRSRYDGGSVMRTDDIGDTVITVGTDTSDMPDIGHDAGRGNGANVGSYSQRAYASSAHTSSRGRVNPGGTRGTHAGAASQARPSRAWSPERTQGKPSSRFAGRGGSRSGYAGRAGHGTGGASRGRSGGSRGRRFVAPDIDIERFIEKSKREIADQKVAALTTPAHIVTNDFNSLIKHPKLREKVSAKGYTTPTPIQDKAIPHVRERKDVVGIANTGTGKTAAFLIPLIDRALVHSGERTLIVVPTRELATQIGDEFYGFSRGLGMTAAVVIGGANIRPQIASVRGARFVIGTPGRLKDLIERRALDMKSFTAIVLDEADRMLDMGFVPDIRFLMERMHHERHSLCFSATMPPEIQKLISEFLKDPINVSTKTGSTSHSVEQSVIRITEGSSKVALLVELLRDTTLDRVIVFGETKHGVERLTKQLIQQGIRADSIHGNKSSNQRKRALDAFKSGRTRVLVATDVAARGLDITDVSHVINYDVPHSYEDYVHRIGRTGRAGAQGKAVTFVGGDR